MKNNILKLIIMCLFTTSLVACSKEEEKPLTNYSETLLPDTLEDIEKNEVYTLGDIGEMVITEIEFNEKPRLSNATFYVGTGEDDTTLAISINFKNLLDVDYNPYIYGGLPEVTFNSLIYDNQYKYKVKYFNGPSAAPLGTLETIYYYIIPKEIAESDKELEAVITINNKDYLLKIR